MKTISQFVNCRTFQTTGLTAKDHEANINNNKHKVDEVPRFQDGEDTDI